MKRNLAVFFAVVVMILAALVGYPDAASTAQRKKPTAMEKMATIDYLVGSWSCAHTVGDSLSILRRNSFHVSGSQLRPCCS